jgi:hypothetical protein
MHAIHATDASFMVSGRCRELMSSWLTTRMSLEPSKLGLLLCTVNLEFQGPQDRAHGWFYDDIK